MRFRRVLFFYLLLAVPVAPDAASAAAEIINIRGEVAVLEPGAAEWSAAGEGTPLSVGDTVRTGADSLAEIRFRYGHTTLMDESCKLRINPAPDDDTLLELIMGSVLSRVEELEPGQSFEVSTPQAVCSVRGTEFTVATDGERSLVAVLSGRVEVRELITGMIREVEAGYYSEVRPGASPTEPGLLPEPEPDPGDDMTRDITETRELREAARREMFNEISRDAVLSRAAEEMKRAEYENRKALIDARGKRVRLEEYIVRPTDRDFKYVVLNHRDGRFDFGKINFFFDNALPEDLTRVTSGMMASEERPEWVLTDLVSVISNTRDRVNEDASGGDMMEDSAGIWRHYFREYSFYIKGEGRDELRLWSRRISPGSIRNFDSLSPRYSYLGDGDNFYRPGESPNPPDNHREYPSGSGSFHLRLRDTYSSDVWISADDYIIDDKGEIQGTRDFEERFDFEIPGDVSVLKNYLAGLNIQRRYGSSEFGDRDIDLVISTKLLLDSGMLDWNLE